MSSHIVCHILYIGVWEKKLFGNQTTDLKVEMCRLLAYTNKHSIFFLIIMTTAGFRRSFRLSRKDRKTNKTMYECKKSDQYDMADVPTYEEVAKYRRHSNEKYRLIVLVGKFLIPELGSCTNKSKHRINSLYFYIS